MSEPFIVLKGEYLMFFEELAVAESSGTATPERLGEIAARNEMEVLGSVPETHL